MKSLTQHIKDAFARDGVTLTDASGKRIPILTLDTVLKASANYEWERSKRELKDAMRECVG